MAIKKVNCEACKFFSPADKASRRLVCRECNNLGYIEIDDKTCNHLPPRRISSEPMVGGWMCECGASGPWDQAYENDYAAALKALKKKPKVKLKDRFPVPNDEKSFARYFTNFPG